MSYGMVMCSICKQEVHQDGDRAVRRGWRHCPDKSPLCEGAAAAYVEDLRDAKGRFCLADDLQGKFHPRRPGHRFPLDG